MDSRGHPISSLLPSTRFSSLLSTNHYASAQEAAEIRALLTAPKAEQAQIDESLAKLKAQMGELLVRRQYLNIFIISHSGLTSPIRGVFDDILVEIFLHCLPADRNPSRSVADAPILLTMVCRRWRELALKTPHLWAALHVSFPSVYRRPDAVAERFKRRADGVEVWFRRSGDLPITFSLVVAEYKELHKNLYKPIVAALSLFAHRWQDVTLQASASMLKLFEGAVNPSNFPRLQKVKVDYMSGRESSIFGPGPQRIPFSELLSKAPLLQSIILSNCGRRICALPLAWENLTHLELLTGLRSSQQTPSALLLVLEKAAHSLRSCTLTLIVNGRNDVSDTDDGNEDSARGRTPVFLPQLHTLCIDPKRVPNDNFHNLFDNLWEAEVQDQQRGLEEQAAFFSSIIAPELTAFTYGVDRVTPNSLPTSLPFIPMLEKSDCQLKKLAIFAAPPLPASLEECLRATPGLSILKFKGNPASPITPNSVDHTVYCKALDSVIQLLTPSADNTEPLCPHLQSLSISANHAASEKLLLQLAESRSPSNVKALLGTEKSNASRLSPMRRLVVGFRKDKEGYQPDMNGEIHDDVILPRIKRLRAEGMEVKITYPATFVAADMPWDGQLCVDSHFQMPAAVADAGTVSGPSLGEMMGLQVAGGPAFVTQISGLISITDDAQ